MSCPGSCRPRARTRGICRALDLSSLKSSMSSARTRAATSRLAAASEKRRKYSFSLGTRLISRRVLSLPLGCRGTSYPSGGAVQPAYHGPPPGARRGVGGDTPARRTTSLWPSWPEARLHSSEELCKQTGTSVSLAPRGRWSRLRPGGYGPVCALLGRDRPTEGGAVNGIEGRGQCHRSSVAGGATHAVANAALATPRSGALRPAQVHGGLSLPRARTARSLVRLL